MKKMEKKFTELHALAILYKKIAYPKEYLQKEKKPFPSFLNEGRAYLILHRIPLRF